MEVKKEIRILTWIIIVFIFAFFMPLESVRFTTALDASLDLVKWYAREHVILCLLPAFFIAGVISVFVSQASVIKYFGARAKKWVAYSVAAVSGTILAVCSCTILPLFSSIHKREQVWVQQLPSSTPVLRSTFWRLFLRPVYLDLKWGLPG